MQTYDLVIVLLSTALLLSVVVGAIVLARGYESASQRRERHLLKSQIGSLLLILDAHGIERPAELRGDDSPDQG